MCKRCQNIFIGLKKTCLGVLDRGERGDSNETGLKEGGGIQILTTVLHSRAAPSLNTHHPSLSDNKILLSNSLSEEFKYI